MLGSIVVAIITVSLLFVGVYLGNSEDKAEDMEEAGSYDEGFFGSLDTLVGGLEKSAERGGETREDRYQEYLKVQEKSESANTYFQEAPKAYQPQPATVPKVETKTNIPTTTTNTAPAATVNTSPPPPSSSSPDAESFDLEEFGDDDMFFDFDDLGDLDF